MTTDTRPAKVGQWTEQALRVLRERYLSRDGDAIRETPEEMCWRVARAIAQGEGQWGKSPAVVHEIANAFYDLMVEGKFLPNSPTLMNAGRGNQLQYSDCYVLPVGDSMEEIFDAVKAAAIIHKSGGGTGFAFSRLRQKDAVVSSTGGKASGPVSFLRVFNGATEAVKQGGTRRGANMGILRVDHPDILEFIDCKLDGGITNFNISVAATDTFMEALARGEEYDLINPHTKKVVGRLSAKEVFDRMVSAAWRTGDPGMVFIDRINASPANPTPELGQVEATNPCVTGDTLVATPGGWRRADAIQPGDIIETIEGPKPLQQVEVNFGTEAFRVDFADGGHLIVTAAHQFYVRTDRGLFLPVRLDRCRIGDEVQTFHAGVGGTAKILKIEAAGIATTYDLYEPQTDTWITEGYVSRGCGEQPLLPNEACNLGSLNVAKFARKADDAEMSIDWDEMERLVRLGVRFLDDVIEMNPYPLPQID